MINLKGFCPFGCGQTLRAEETRAANRVICWASDCPDPLAVQKILDDPRTDHVVRFDGGGFTIQHPLRERISDALFSCKLHLFCVGLPGPPEGRPGVFRVFEEDGEWVLERTETLSVAEEASS